VSPRDQIETVLVAICCEVLQRAQISVFDNFFTLGGDSLRTTLRLDVPISMMLRKAPVAEFADEIRRDLPTLEWIERPMAEADALSDDEAQRLLAQELGHSPRDI
jgi:hypothetical protein